jgi:hypothetical protein
VSEARSGIDGFSDEIARHRRSVGARLPSYDRVLALVGDQLDGELGRRLGKAWARRRFEAYYDRPLLLLATLRFDALASGPDHPLWRALAADPPDPAAVTAAALDRAFGRDRPRVWHSLTRRRVQTNEVSRAVAWLWPAALAGADVAAGAARPLVLCDMGCSGGLNLVADSLELSWTELGPVPRPLAVARRPRVLRRLGFDREPIDPVDEDDSNWLRACVWVGERQRMDRLEQALAAFRAARASDAPPVIEAIDARDMPGRLRELSAGDRSGALWLAYQTVVREYLGPSRAPYLDGMRDWLAALPPGRAAWIELEEAPHGGTRELPFALVAHVREPGGGIVDLVLGRCSYHPTEVAPEPDAVDALRPALDGRARPARADRA